MTDVYIGVKVSILIKLEVDYLDMT